MENRKSSRVYVVSFIVSGVFAILVAFTHLVGIMIWGEYKFLFQMTHGGVGGTPMSNVNPMYWYIVIVELLVSVVLVLVGILQTIRREKHVS